MTAFPSSCMVSIIFVSWEHPTANKQTNTMRYNTFVFIIYSHFLVSILKSTACVLGATALMVKGDLPIADIGSHTLVFVSIIIPSASSHSTLYLKRLVPYDFLFPLT